MQYVPRRTQYGIVSWLTGILCMEHLAIHALTVIVEYPLSRTITDSAYWTEVFALRLT